MAPTIQTIGRTYIPRAKGGVWERMRRFQLPGVSLESTISHILSTTSSNKSEQPHSPEGLAALVAKLESEVELLD